MRRPLKAFLDGVTSHCLSPNLSIETVRVKASKFSSHRRVNKGKSLSGPGAAL
jgi:hypothetical protein